MKKILFNNGLSIAVLSLFGILFLGQFVSGFHENNQERLAHGEKKIVWLDYLSSAHFLEATFENWESEFLQMCAYVVLTVFLFQKGSSESKEPGKKEDVDEDPRLHQGDPNAPGPVRKGGWRLRLYEHSLSLALALLFLASWIGHAIAGTVNYNDYLKDHALPAVSLAQYIRSSRFWFESFQNWQSEFLAVSAIVILSIRLREKGSPESKPVAAPHSATGK